MELKLIENENKKEIGTINLNFTPRKEEIIEFKNETYVCKHIIHSEKGVHILVNKKPLNYEILW
jgi:hypothetical protein